MRIVYFLPDIDAGVARVVKNLLKYRPKNSDQFAVVLFSRKEQQSGPPVTGIEHAVEIIRFTYSQKENIFAVYKRLARTLHSPCDVIVGNDGFEIGMATALRLKNPVAYILHGDFKYYYSICRLNQNVIDLFITISNKITLELEQSILTKANKEKVRQIYFPVAIAGEEPYKRNGVSTGPLHILFAGTLDERKGAHLLFDIYTGLSKVIADFTFTIIGNGKLEKQLNDQFAGNANVYMEGWKPHSYVLQKMKKSNIFLFPSFLEGLPNVLIEALYSGAVPVASNLESGVVDVIENEVNGLLVETGDVKSFISAIQMLNDDRSLLHSLSTQGAEGLHSRFEPFKQAALYDDAIKKTANKNSGSKQYPPYQMGRLLNKPWLPNTIVKAIRSVLKHPKL